VVWWRIQAITAASARCPMGMRSVRATVPLPTGVACAATRAASVCPSGSQRGENRRKARTSSSNDTAYAACVRSRRAVSACRRLA
jgi:hypothetical protein